MKDTEMPNPLTKDVRVLSFAALGLLAIYLAHVVSNSQDACNIYLARCPPDSIVCNTLMQHCAGTPLQVIRQIDYISEYGTLAVFCASITSLLICITYRNSNRTLMILFALFGVTLLFLACTLFAFPFLHAP